MCEKIMMKHEQMWNCGTNGDKHLRHKSFQQTMATILIYNNFAPTASAIFGVITEHPRRQRKRTRQESVITYCSV
jgi:hypothetical protein